MAVIAQLAEHGIVAPGVMGSTPIDRPIIGGTMRKYITLTVKQKKQRKTKRQRDLQKAQAFARDLQIYTITGIIRPSVAKEIWL